MSNLDLRPTESECGGVVVSERSPAPVVLMPREVPLGGQRAILVRRTVPHREIRTIGAWCFADHYGPVDLARPGARGMVVPPHPHVGLQTVTWLLAGEVDHRDSVGSRQLVRPGELSLMTAGRGIAHSEYSTTAATHLLGVQLWVALTEAHRHQDPHFAHHADLPSAAGPGWSVTTFAGSFAGLDAPARMYSPIAGAQVRLDAGASATLPLERDFEYGVLAADGSAVVDGEALPFAGLRYQGWGRTTIRVTADAPATLVVLGGEPLAEHLLMWWNFVGRDHDEIAAARADWEAGRRFGSVAGDDREPMPAPPLPSVRMLPRPSRPQG